MEGRSKSGLSLSEAKEKINQMRHKCVELRKSGAFTLSEVEQCADEVSPIYADLNFGVFGNDQQLSHKMEELFAMFFDIASKIDQCSEEQWPLYEKLTNVYRGLLKLKETGRDNITEKDVSPWQDKLNEIDSKKVDGKFLDSKGQIPKGQAWLSTLESRCYRLSHELLVQLEEKEKISNKPVQM